MTTKSRVECNKKNLVCLLILQHNFKIDVINDDHADDDVTNNYEEKEEGYFYVMDF